MASTRAHIELDLSGLKAVKSEAAKRRITLKAVKAAAKIVAPAAKSRAPRRVGRGGGGLRQAIGIKAVPGRKGRSTALAVIGARLKVVKQIRPPRGKQTIKYVPGRISHIVDGGAAPHAIKSGASRGRGNQDKATSHTIQHPGTKPTHFLRNAWASTRAEAIREGQRVLGEEIEKVLAKQAAKALKGK